MAKHDMRGVKFAGQVTSQFKIECELGWRQYTERFREAGNARLFVEAMLGKDKPRWKSPTTIVAKSADVLKISCDRLEELMEVGVTTKHTLPAFTLEKIEKFLRGVWDQQNVPKETRTKSRHDVADQVKKLGADSLLPNGQTVSLADICKRRGWDERVARRKLRASGEKREGRWSWSKADVAGIEGKLEGLLG
jgi:hypothetical protein